ncbi:hypothetical protein C7447_10582 [Tenacibaculum adriaticum]|uniref:Lipoprotein n=1 Tax=Tenacibaculum adriaticum TaxID=413713 RepID=A0A5S5DQY1_9FLAO|nr:hypothetical protein [Tenacibaculum adriaticum]TYP97069.1 hypothetical protein C7447_10582 [Tenacibaculum adriaticum]
MKSLKIKLLILLFTVAVISCKNNKDEKKSVDTEIRDVDNVKIDSDDDIFIEGKSITELLNDYSLKKTLEADNFTFNIAANNKDNNRILIYTKGLENEFRKVISFEGKVLETFTLDQNNDGYKEFYITTTPLKGRSYASVGDVEIIGFASHENKEIVEIAVEDIKSIKNERTDKVDVVDGKLQRSFIVNNDPQKYNYNLNIDGDDYELTYRKVK